MIPVRKLIPSVCTAVKELGESKGTSIQDITAYIRDIIHVKNVSAINVRKAVKSALENQLLKETKLGRFKLIVNNVKGGAPHKMDRLTEFDILTGRCPRRRKRTICKGRTSKRAKKPRCRRGCTPIWVPKRRRGCRRKARSSCPRRRRRRSACPKRRRSACPRRRRMTCPKLRRKRRSCPRKHHKRSTCPRRRRRRSCIRRCEDPAAQLGFQDSQSKNGPNEEMKTTQANQ